MADQSMFLEVAFNTYSKWTFFLSIISSAFISRAKINTFIGKQKIIPRFLAGSLPTGVPFQGSKSGLKSRFLSTGTLPGKRCNATEQAIGRYRAGVGTLPNGVQSTLKPPPQSGPPGEGTGEDFPAPL